MRVSILTLDLSNNCLGRAHVLAKLLERNHAVEIIGPEMGDGVWPPVKDEYDYKKLGTGGMIPEFLLKVRNLKSQITGDVVYASKPRMTSYGVGLLRTVGSDVPLLLDIDDWELGFVYGEEHPLLTHLKQGRQMLNLNSANYTWLLEQLSILADDRTVSNRYLQNKFGGTIIPHARDTDIFDPAKFKKREIRKELGLPLDKSVVMFSGTPRPHKGVDDLIRAVQHLDDENVVGVIVGAGDSGYVQRLRELSDENVIIRGPQPFDELPKWVATSDIISIPQRRSPATQGQLPAKVFDAMAMAKPVIATEVNDLPEILADCGIIVSPDSPVEIADAIEYLHSNPQKRRELGHKARKKCVEKYSYDAVAPKLDQVIRNIV